MVDRTAGTGGPVPTPRSVAGTVRWSDDVDAVVGGDLTAAFACVTPAGGAVVLAVAPCGLRSRDEARLGFSSSLGLPAKLERIVEDPRVALAFHAREHGFATGTRYVLAQGVASVDVTPSRPRLEAFVPDAQRFLGPVRRGRVWDRLLHEYYLERVFVDVAVERVTEWPDLWTSGRPEVLGAPEAAPPPPQDPPAAGTLPRVPLRRLAARVRRLPHVLIAYAGADGYPVVVPVAYRGVGPSGLRLAAAPGVLPQGGRRAGFLAHGYRARLVGLRSRFGTGWLDVDDAGRAVYAPHTVHGFDAPPVRDLLLVVNGLRAKAGLRRARRTGVAARLATSGAARHDARPTV